MIVWRGLGSFVDTGPGEIKVTKSPFIYTSLSIYLWSLLVVLMVMYRSQRDIKVVSDHGIGADSLLEARGRLWGQRPVLKGLELWGFMA